MFISVYFQRSGVQLATVFSMTPTRNTAVGSLRTDWRSKGGYEALFYDEKSLTRVHQIATSAQTTQKL